MAGRDYTEEARGQAFTEAATIELMLVSFGELERIGQVYQRERPRLPDCLREVNPVPQPDRANLPAPDAEPAASPAAPEERREFRYSAETQLAVDREYSGWLRSARPLDSDWEVGHLSPSERIR